MNLATIGAMLGAIASFLAIVAYLDNKITTNRARLRAEKARMNSIVIIQGIHSRRITTLERHASRSKEEEPFQVEATNALIDLEEEEKAEYQKHQTDLT